MTHIHDLNKAEKAEPVCPPDFDRDYPLAERIDLDGYCVWAYYLGRHDGCVISEPVLTDAAHFLAAHGVEATPATLALIAEHDETHIEAVCEARARQDHLDGSLP